MKTDRLSSEAIQAVLAPTHVTCRHPLSEHDLKYLAHHGFTRVVTFSDGSGRYDNVTDTMEILDLGHVRVRRTVVSDHAVLAPELHLKPPSEAHAQVQDRP